MKVLRLPSQAGLRVNLSRGDYPALCSQMVEKRKNELRANAKMKRPGTE